MPQVLDYYGIISIHVLREEDDTILLSFRNICLVFQSTSSARRTTIFVKISFASR